MRLSSDNKRTHQLRSLDQFINTPRDLLRRKNSQTIQTTDAEHMTCSCIPT